MGVRIYVYSIEIDFSCKYKIKSLNFRSYKTYIFPQYSRFRSLVRCGSNGFPNKLEVSRMKWKKRRVIYRNIMPIFCLVKGYFIIIISKDGRDDLVGKIVIKYRFFGVNARV